MTRKRRPSPRSRFEPLEREEPTSGGRAAGFGPYDADPKGHEFDPVTRTCRRCHLIVGTVGVTGSVPCLSPRYERRVSDGDDPSERRAADAAERRALLMRIEGALSHSRRSIARELLAECYRELGGRNRVK